MICRNCGTEIADKALVCYRCGTATFEAQRRPPAPASSASPLVGVIALAALVLAAVYLGSAGSDAVPAWVPYVIGGLAAVVLVWRLLSRARRPR
jgi:branched-subunit amino acid transport protein